MSSAASGSPDSLVELKDDELIRLLPATAHEKYDEGYHSLSDEDKKRLQDKREGFIREPFKKVLDTLWLRHERNMRDVLQGKVFAPGSTLCPPQEPSKEDFIAAVLARAYQAFLARTFREEYPNFPGYVWTLMFNSALDERKHLKGRYQDKDDKDASDKSHVQHEQLASEAEDEATGPQKPILVPFPERMPDPPAGQLNLTSLDVRRIMNEYAKESEQNKISAWALRKKWIEERTWKELANELLPPNVDGRSASARAISARRFVEKDEQKLRPRLSPLSEKRR